MPSPDVELPGESLNVFFLCRHQSICPSGAVGKSSLHVYVFVYYMEMTLGHWLCQTYINFAGMTDHWSVDMQNLR